MNNTQRAKLDTCNRVKDFNTKHATELATITEYAAEQTAFMAALGIINNAAQVQSQTAGAATDAVETAKETMAAITIKYAKRGKVKATQANNKTLANHLDHGITYISRATKTLAVQRAKDIKDHLNTNLATLTNITAANITEITNAISAYDTIKDQPITNIQSRTATGTNPLPAAFTAAFKAIDNMNDLIDSYFTGTNQPLVDEFDLARQILNTGIHHSGVEGIVSKNGNPVADASVSVVGTDKVAKTDIDGHYVIAKIKAGDHTIEASNEAGDTASKVVHVTKGNFETVNFTL